MKYNFRQIPHLTVTVTVTALANIQLPSPCIDVVCFPGKTNARFSKISVLFHTFSLEHPWADAHCTLCFNLNRLFHFHSACYCCVDGSQSLNQRVWVNCSSSIPCQYPAAWRRSLTYKVQSEEHIHCLTVILWSLTHSRIINRTCICWFWSKGRPSKPVDDSN